MSTTHDLLGIGLGPFNLGLACLADSIGDLDAVFLDAADGFSWHPGMMLPDATLQVPFLADLVTLADPTSRFSYLAFLKDVGRLYPFYIRESFYPLRREYDDYCRWAADRLDSVRWGERVVAVEHDGGAYVVWSSTGRRWRARHLALGTGTVPRLPFEVEGPALHSADYLARKADLLDSASIAVVGSGQSAAEVYADLLAEQESHGFELIWVTRSPRFFPMEYTKLTLEMTSPEWSSYFQMLPAPRRAEVQAGHAALSKGISSDTVNAIFDELYRRQVSGGVETTLLTATEVTDARWDGSGYDLELRHNEQESTGRLRAEQLVLATGYAPRVPDFLEPVRDRIRWDEHGRFLAGPTFAVDRADRDVFVQNAEEHTHGFVAPDLGMGAMRNSVILAQVLGRTPYVVEKRIAFQEWGIPDRYRQDGGVVMRLTLEPLDPIDHLPLLHEWLTHPRSTFWGMQDATPAEVHDEYARIAGDPHHDALLGRADGAPAFLMERYDPAHSPLAGLPEIREGDVGMHVLVAPTDTPVHGFTAAVMRQVMGACFDDPSVRRVVVEPDVRNDKIAVLNAAVGFVVARTVDLPDKTAALSFCSREDFTTSALGGAA